MSLTKPLNSKVNMKQYSNADLPMNPKQPAIARYAAESTLNQTVINLPFQIDTVNAADSFVLTVDGKMLTPGSTNDYQFSAVDSFGFSSTITLNYPLVAGLNIQGIKLGLKKETEFVQDARFTALYEGIDQGLQGFVRTADVMVATTSAGAPGNGSFYSSIQNRASITELRSDLKTRMGADRMILKSMFPVVNEFGPNGETVQMSPEDQFGQVRFVGSWSTTINNAGIFQTSGTSTASYIEVTFYGTQLNLLMIANTSTKNFVVAVDGGAESANVLSGAYNSVMTGRGYGQNNVIIAASGLSLGVHTVKIRNTGSSDDLAVYGFEFINNTTTMASQAGSTYRAGKKVTSISQTFAHNSGFESGTLGTRGGHVVVYQKTDGTIGRAVTPTNASQGNLTSADHTNEEIVKVYYPREFGVGRSDDFTTLAGSATRAYHLEDDTTALSCISAAMIGEQLTCGSANNASNITLHFVGTGLDIVRQDDANGTEAGQYQVIVDGVTVGTLNSQGSTSQRVEKLVSGLPYGSHTLTINRLSPVAFTPRVARFLVYQPKTPAIPAGAVVIADYNVVANFVANTTLNLFSMSTGVIRKFNSREISFLGSGWSTGLSNSNTVGGIYCESTASGAVVQYSFYGTGFDYRYLPYSDASSNITVSLNGTTLTAANFPTASFSTSGGTFNSGTGQWSQNIASTTTYGASLAVSGLPLSTYTVRMTNNAAAAMRTSAIDIITPIHSHRNGENQTNYIGSQSISDNRRTGMVKDNAVDRGVWNAVGNSTVGNITTSSTSFVPMPDMFVIANCKTGRLRISCAVSLQAGYGCIAIDGVPVLGTLVGHYEVNGTYSDSIAIDVPPGIHKIDVMWRVTSGSASSFIDGASNRSLNVEEI